MDVPRALDVEDPSTWDPPSQEWWRAFCLRYWKEAFKGAYSVWPKKDMAREAAARALRELRPALPAEPPPRPDALVVRAARDVTREMLEARRESLWQLYQRYHKPFLKVASRVLREHPEEAERAVNETFTKLVQKLPRLWPRGMKSYAARAVNTTALDVWKEMQKSARMESSLSEELSDGPRKKPDEEGVTLEDILADEGAEDPQEALDKKEERRLWEERARVLPEALKTLSPREREAIDHWMEGLKKRKEIALAMGVGEETAKELLKRAFKKLREFFADPGNKEVGDE